MKKIVADIIYRFCVTALILAGIYNFISARPDIVARYPKPMREAIWLIEVHIEILENWVEMSVHRK